MTAFYNEHDPYAAAWLRNLIDAGHIAPGIVDERSIEDVRPDDLRGFTQCHWFAGLGIWSLALRRAGWDDSRPVWSGSCPCQPFSAAGQGAGFADERHLWPHWHWLISQCRPAAVFGEQVAQAADWLTLVRGDLEALGYAVGAMPIEAASAGADHKRDRFFFVANAAGQRGDRSEGAAESQGRTGAQDGGDGDRGLIECSDGRWRRRPPSGVRWVGDGVAGRVAQLHAIGNAIDPRPAQAFIEAVMDAA